MKPIKIEYQNKNPFTPNDKPIAWIFDIKGFKEVIIFKHKEEKYYIYYTYTSVTNQYRNIVELPHSALTSDHFLNFSRFKAFLKISTFYKSYEECIEVLKTRTTLNLVEKLNKSNEFNDLSTFQITN